MRSESPGQPGQIRVVQYPRIASYNAYMHVPPIDLSSLSQSLPPVVYEREMTVENRQASVAETMRVARNVASRHAELLRRLA
jgi:hypothetical protein